jgi:hypothetical protein
MGFPFVAGDIKDNFEGGYCLYACPRKVILKNKSNNENENE